MENVIQNFWTKSKLLIKALIIAFIVLILQIPTFYVKELIQEREERQRQAIAEVSSRWAGSQTVTGPVIVIPFWKAELNTRSKQFAYFLPDELFIQTNAIPEEKHRGIYKVMLYTANVSITGKYNNIALDALGISPQDVIWNEAVVKIPIADNKGLNDEFTLRWNDTSLVLSPQTVKDPSINNGLEANLRWTGPAGMQKINFSTSMNLNGSQQLLFTPTGRTTSVTMASQWPHPSFTGSDLPQTTTINSKGFSATWKSISHKRPFPQQWIGGSYSFSSVPYINADVRTTSTSTSYNNLNESSFGANLFVPVSGYQKTMRSVKYAILCILLTFASFFIIETTNKRSVHPFQYGLIGVALILFYTLLLSLSEYIGFDTSYFIASFFTIGLVGWFVKGLLSSSKLASILSLVLVLLYVYVFTLLQLQDYSLLLGSIGLFLTLAVIMHFSKKIQW